MHLFAVYGELDYANDCYRISKCVSTATIIINITQIYKDIEMGRCKLVRAVDELDAYKRGLEIE